MIEQMAMIYVNVLEPLGKALLVFVGILSILWVLILINDAKKGKELIHNVMTFTWKGIVGFFHCFGLVIWGIIKFIIRITHIMFAAIRDFFVSKV